MATIKEIATKIGVSTATVSRVLNNDQTFSVSAEVRLKVLKCASELGYKTPRSKIKRRKVFIIGVADWRIVPSGMLPGYDMWFSKNIETPADIRLFRINRNEVKEVDGIIALGSFTDDELGQLLLCSTNIIFINSDIRRDYSHNRIVADLDIAWSAAINYLTSFTKRIGYIGGIYSDNEIRIGELHHNIMKQKLGELGLYHKELFFAGRLSDSDGSSLLRAVVHNGAEAIIVSSQLLEKGVISEYEKQNLKIPLVLTRDMPFDIGAVDNNFPKVKVYPDTIWQVAVEILIAHGRNPKLNGNVFIPSIFEKP